jgi:hypothetical protein
MGDEGHSGKLLSESELLHRFRQAIAAVNERTGSRCTFVHGTDDGILENRAERWNEAYVTTRAVGECDGTATSGLPHRFTVHLHQDEFGPTFRLVERFAPPLHYPTDAASVFTIDCDIWPTLRAIVMPDLGATERSLLITGLQTTGPFEVGALARSIRDLHACKIAVIHRYQYREGPDHWTEHNEILRRLGG